MKDLASKLVNEIEECDKKIIYLKNVQRQLRVSIYVTVTPRPNDRNMLQHCWEQQVAPVWPPSCEVMRHVATCWVLLAQI